MPLQVDSPVNRLAIQFGGTGNDTLDATVTLQGGSFSPPWGTELKATVLLDSGKGNDVINATANVALAVSGTVTLSTDVLG